jgi:membrane-associated phospholipid phosphatase
MDYRAFKLVNGLTGHWADGLFVALASGLPVVMVLAVALVFLLRRSRGRKARRSGALLGTVGAGLALLVCQPISHAVARARPYLAHPGHAHLLIARSQDFSFPSDHAAGGFALAIGIWLYDRTLGGVLLILATILSLSRVVVGTHYPGDVLGGAALGTLAALFFWWPPVRRPLHDFADWASGLYERLAAWALPAPS